MPSLLQWLPSLEPPPQLDTAERIRQAVIDTIVESGTMLPREPNEWLTIVGLNLDPGGQAQSQRPYLSIQGSDLDDIKKGHFTREWPQSGESGGILPHTSTERRAMTPRRRAS